MISSRSKTKALVFLFVIVSLVFFSCSVLMARTLVRTNDPVIIKAKDAGPLDNKKISGFSVFSLSPLNNITPLPFQIDEKNNKDDYIFPNGKEKNPEDADNMFNGTDEFVFMAKDMGEKLSNQQMMELDKSGEVFEISAKDPVDGAVSYAYIVYDHKKPPQISSEDYVDIDPENNRIVAEHYELGFAKDAPMAIDELFITEAGGGDGVDYIDRLKARLHCEIAGISIDKNEDDFSEEIVAWIDGPVRVVRRTRSRLILFWNIPSPSSKLDSTYYYNSYVFPMEIYLPLDVGFIVKDAHFRVSMDSPRLSGERRYRNSLYPEGVIQDGKMSEKELEMSKDKRPFNWSATGTIGPDGKDYGAWFNRMIVEADNPEWQPSIFYIDDENHLDPPDVEAGSFGNGGYQISGLTNLTAGTYHLESVMSATPEFDLSMVELFMRTIDHPLEITIKKINQ
jgi:hypothetical protein